MKNHWCFWKFTLLASWQVSLSQSHGCWQTTGEFWVRDKRQFNSNSTSQGISICTTSPNPIPMGRFKKSSHDNCTILETGTFYSNYQHQLSLPFALKEAPLSLSVFFVTKAYFETWLRTKIGRVYTDETCRNERNE